VGEEATVTATVKSSAASAQGRIIDRLALGEGALALTATGSLRFYPPRRIDTPATSASRLLTGPGGARTPRGSNSQLSGAVVLIGLDGELGEKVRTARGAAPPAAIHALVAAQIVAGEALRRPGWTGYLEALGVMALGAAAIMAAQRFTFWRVMGGAALLSLLLVLGAFAAFAFGNLLLDPLAPALALFVGGLSVAGGRSISGVLRDDNYRGSFHDTLPEAAMQRLRDEDGGEMLQGVYREITVLACELRLTDEDLQNLERHPDDMTKLFASASLDLRQTIINTGGVADQAEGGRLLGYYNAPLEMADHAQASCAAALRLIESMDKINADLETSSRTRGLQLHLAIGIATGRCFIGPMGRGRNNRYSAIGPAVDRAIFLRSQSEYYGPAMITDESTHKETHHHFAYLELDKIRLRNAKRPFSIYALIGNPFIKSSRGFRNLDETHRKFLAAYRAGDATAAREMLDAAKKSPGAKIALFDIYEERMRRVAERGFPQDWDGVHDIAS
jgi:adenylate cyclase